MTGRIIYFLDELEKVYHNEANSPELGHDEPLDGLIMTVLSQNTNDRNRDAAFTNLKANFPDWQSVFNAGSEGLADSIRTAGLANTKSQRIIEILRIIHADFNEYSIKKLAKYNPDDIRKYLLDLPGVGAKTAACVMLFDFKLPAFPVDTHIERVTKRFGIAEKKLSPEEISHYLEGIIPASRFLGGHVNIIAHGRAVCHARKPDCKNCVLNEKCDKII